MANADLYIASQVSASLDSPWGMLSFPSLGRLRFLQWPG